MKPLVLVTAPVGTRSGYGSRSRDIVRALVKLDKYDVKVFNVPWGNTPQNALMIDHPKDKPIIVSNKNKQKVGVISQSDLLKAVVEGNENE